MRKLFLTLWIIGALSFIGAGVLAYNGYLSTIYPLFATAGETCYALEPGQRVIGVGNRPDYLAVTIKTEAGKDVAICFLRPPVSNPNWEAR